MSSQPGAGAAPEPKKNKTMIWIIVAVVAVVAIPVGIAILGIVAAIAIPSLLRARVSANEASAIGDTRTVISAEAAYSASGTTYGTLECLVTPQPCLRGYSGPAFLDATAIQPVKTGYRRTFRLNSDSTAFTYVAEPVTHNQTGVRAFCGDQTGMICYTTNGTPPGTTSTGCDGSTCQPLL